MKNFLLRIYRTITIKSIANFDEKQPDVKEWIEFINSLPDSKDDDFLASYNKYLCRMHYFGLGYKIMINIAAFFALMAFYMKSFFVKPDFEVLDKKDSKINSRKMLLIEQYTPASDDVFPRELFDEFGIYYKVDETYQNIKLAKKEFYDAYKIVRKNHFFKFHYRYLILRELSLHSSLIDRFDQDATVVYVNERNVVSPILTKLYEAEGRELISFMHGEDLLHLIKAYKTFSRYYVWDKRYIPMYINVMKSNTRMFIEYVPEKLQYQFEKKSEYLNDLTYYLSAESKTSLLKIKAIIDKLKEKDKKMIIRLHPRMSEIEEIEEVFDPEDIEDLHKDIKESILDTRYVVGICSTVMTEAYYGGKEVIIDNLTNNEFYYNLKDRMCLMFERNMINLSEYLEDLGIDYKK